MKKLVLKAGLLSILSFASVSLISCGDDDKPSPVQPTSDIVSAEDFKTGNKAIFNSGKELKLDAKVNYELTTGIVLENGTSLRIPAGTKIVANGGTKGYLAVAQGSKLYVDGTASKPVVFTSTIKEQGQWGGIVICGKAPINAGTTATSEVANLPYGGTESGDNSGSIEYLVLEYTGAKFSDTKEYNGLSLFGVGSATKLNNIYVLDGADDGIEFFGGTVSASNLVLIGNEDDALDWTEGWTGSATNVYTKRRDDDNKTGNRGIEADNNSKNNLAEPFSNPTIKNITLVGGASGESQGIKLRQGTKGTFDNVVIAGFNTGIDIQHDASIEYFTSNNHIKNVKFVDVEVQSKGKNSSDQAINVSETYTINENATGAGNGIELPSWASWIN